MMRAWVDGAPADTLPLSDRGLNYGDGVFETLLIAQGEPVWWDAHWARLRRGCEVLGFAAPAAAVVRDEARRIADGEQRAVLKLIVTRGDGGRGYAPPSPALPRRVSMLHAAPSLLEADYREGIEIRWCDTVLAGAPRLAGLKHLNRLDQVLARAEWRDAAIAEGLMRDAQGRVLSATAANLFIVRGDVLFTPDLSHAGVAGTARAWVMRQAEVRITELRDADIESADELFLTSSLRGILPVARLGGRQWTPGAMTRGLQQRLWNEIPALRPTR